MPPNQPVTLVSHEISPHDLAVSDWVFYAGF